MRWEILLIVSISTVSQCQDELPCNFNDEIYPQLLGYEPLPSTTFPFTCINNDHIRCDTPNSIVSIDFNNANPVLEGSIPSQIDCLWQLQYLDLSGNKLSGTIPTEIGSVSSLYHIDLSANRLSGTIPDVWSIFFTVSRFDVSRNRLHGPFPTTLATAMDVCYAFGMCDGNPCADEHNCFECDAGMLIPENVCVSLTLDAAWNDCECQPYEEGTSPSHTTTQAATTLQMSSSTGPSTKLSTSSSVRDLTPTVTEVERATETEMISTAFTSSVPSPQTSDGRVGDTTTQSAPSNYGLLIAVVIVGTLSLFLFVVVGIFLAQKRRRRRGKSTTVAMASPSSPRSARSASASARTSRHADGSHGGRSLSRHPSHSAIRAKKSSSSHVHRAPAYDVVPYAAPSNTYASVSTSLPPPVQSSSTYDVVSNFNSGGAAAATYESVETPIDSALYDFVPTEVTHHQYERVTDKLE